MAKNDEITAVVPLTTLEFATLVTGNRERHVGSCKEIRVDVLVNNELLGQIASRKL